MNSNADKSSVTAFVATRDTSSPVAKLRQSAVAIAVATTLAIHAQALYADEASPEPASSEAPPESEIVVTGTRRTGVEIADSPAPIQVLDSNTLKRVGQPDLIQAIAQNVPSFTAQAFGGDTANLTLSAKLRGLSPNHALVLIDGKRRHTTGNLAVLGGPYQGGAGADLNFIPVSAIERIEVLQDGAAAQYGTDAIGGVLNIILKKSPSGGALGLGGGGYADGGGDTGNVSANIGFGVREGAFLNITAESRAHERSDRGDIDPRVVNPANIAAMPSLLLAPDYPYVNRIQGDAKYQLSIASYNGGFDLSDSTQFYSFGTYGKKHAEAFENYRTPNRIPAMYPYGFNPLEEIQETDFGATVGVKGKVFDSWRWDLASTYGRDDIEVNTIHSGNVSLFNDTGSSPSDFHAGDFIATQWTTNLDVGRDFDLGLATPLNVAIGIEHRHESYEIKPGDPASRYKEGSQSYPGFALTDAGFHTRDNEAVYVDLALSPTSKLQLDIAGRYEHFSDFGDTTVGKFTGRYDFTPTFAMRGTFSTGFRAPTLAEEYYSATNVSPTSAFVQLPPNSAAAALVGINGLKPEDATNYSLGIVLRPFEKFTATLDAYQIKIKDRIVGSGSLFGQGGAINSPAVTAAIAANGNVLDPTVTQTGINIFANGLDTRTRGADLALTYFTELKSGRIDWSFGANYNETEVTKVNPTPAPLAPQSLFSPTAISDLETTSPKYRTVLGALWTYDRFSVNLRETLYGPSSRLQSQDGGTYYKVSIGATPITDLEIAYQASALRFSVGANNLFNRYPDKVNPALMAVYRAAGSTSAVAQYPSFSPFGINGGYYYGRLVYSF
jgi:iron complex outermembrane receptor protein